MKATDLCLLGALYLALLAGCGKEEKPDLPFKKAHTQNYDYIIEISWDGCQYITKQGFHSSFTHKANCTNHPVQKLPPFMEVYP